MTFLSGVFPLGERSGVNLRGEYGPTWEVVRFPRDDTTGTQEEAKPEEAMAVDESLTEKPATASKLTAETIEKKEGE